MKRIIPFHPFLFALFPILFLFSYNLKSITISLGELVLPILASLTLAGVLWLIFFLLLWQKYKAAVLATSAQLLFFSHGHFYNIVNEHISKDTYLILFELLILFAILFCTLKIKGKWLNFTKILNLVSIVMVLYSVVQIGIYTIQAQGINLENQNIPINIDLSKIEYKPDIYYIILDAYSRNDILQEVNNFDNSSFTDFLKEKGFFIGTKSTSNYESTRHSLTSSINFNYLSNSDLEYENYWAPYKKFTHNAIFDFLKNQGYRTVAFSSGFTFTELKGYADFYFSPSFTLTEFQNVLLATTPIPSFLELTSKTSQFDLHRKLILYTFDKLANLDNIKSPKFVFAHIISPHEPYVFGKNGEAVDPKESFRLKGSNDPNDIVSEKYINQLQFINKKVSELVTEVFENTDKPPVIVLQADHAHGLGCREKTHDSCLKNRMSILNAYYLPNIEKEVLYDEITPVNTFRYIFNNYFGADYDILEDRNYIKNNTEFMEVTDKVKDYQKK